MPCVERLMMPEEFDKRSLSERDICTKYITPSIVGAGWNVQTQIREEVTFAKGRINPKGKLVSRGASKRADYILYYKPNLPLAVVEAKDNQHSVGDGMQQALGYAEIMNIPLPEQHRIVAKIDSSWPFAIS